ncbi:hypothetical protein [Xylanibacter ruminicola]|uniref:O-antigen ligase like membrane protein n=1 Tax=Xylanibacter ruminicola TaxID=839 RepID=A0A1M6R9P7_XYLRU|nr:hypothetical protein [Xylanibacter ruminicola]SHK29209.1 hypothetical protein SAMN05216463_101155 [Xylanibacter ruminicola]
MVVKKTDLLVWAFSFMAMHTLIANFYLLKSEGTTTVFFLLLLVIYFTTPNKGRLTIKKSKETSIFLVGILAIYSISTFFNLCPPILLQFFCLMYAVLFLRISYELQVRVIKCFVWVLAILLACSIVEFTIYGTTGWGIVLGQSTRETAARETHFVNLVFNLIGTDYGVVRFQSIANEPGRIGTLCGMLLFLAWRVRSLRIPFIVFVISGIISFSLAFFVLLGIFLITHVRVSLKKMIIGIAVMGATIYVTYDRFQEKIVMRIMADDGEMEDIETIDNRTTVAFDKYYNQALEKGQLWLGVGANNLPKQINIESRGGSAGAKKWIFQYGFVALAFLFITFNKVFLRRLRRKPDINDYGFLIAYWLSFYQRSDVMSPFSVIAFMAIPIIDIISAYDNKITKWGTKRK